MAMRNKSVDVHQFAMVPRADIPRSAFLRESAHKTTLDAGYIYPIYCDEVLPGDDFKMRMTAIARMATPIWPIMDNLYMDVFWFFVPCRLLWTNWRRFMGEQASPADSISFTVPVVTATVGGYAIGSIFDYFGLPTVGQMGGAASRDHIALPLRAYNLIWQEWFRDENLQNTVVINMDDGPDAPADFALLRRGKRHDYFTSALPWPQKGNTAVSLPLGTSAPVEVNMGSAGTPALVLRASDYTTGANDEAGGSNASNQFGGRVSGHTWILDPNGSLYADLSTATAATINQLRQAFQIQKLLERDARGGTRYTEIVRAHFGVVSPDARLQRPEYLGGATFRVNVTPIVQQSQTGLTGGSTPLGTVGGFATLGGQAGFTQSFTEHGYILGLVSVRADLTYQQGLERMWSRSTRYDFYFPAFAMLGEQSILNQEIYCDGSANDLLVFGYQERWAELRYKPSRISSVFRSTAAGTLDAWHLAQEFSALPALNSTFIQDTPPVQRVVAAGAAADGQQFIFDSIFSARCVRPLPMYSVPGLLDHF